MDTDTIQQMFRQFGTHDLQQYLFLGTPNVWGFDPLEEIEVKVKSQMEKRLWDIPPEYLSSSDAFYFLMRKSFQYAEGTIWQYAFAQTGDDEPDRNLAQHLEQWYDDKFRD
jgi:hypothetical protein